LETSLESKTSLQCVSCCDVFQQLSLGQKSRSTKDVLSINGSGSEAADDSVEVIVDADEPDVVTATTIERKSMNTEVLKENLLKNNSTTQ
jgi:hypothetical protein